MSEVEFAQSHFSSVDEKERFSCDFCAEAGEEERACYETDFSIEGFGANLFSNPRPLRLCQQCLDQLPEQGKTITCHWDTYGDTEGWYCIVEQDGDGVDDSMKAWFPVNVDHFSKEEPEALHKALEAEFPHCEIEVKEY